VWSSSQPEIVIQATQQAEPYEGLQSEEDHRVMLESTPKRDKGKGKANAGIAGESATKHKDVVPEQFPLDTSDLPFEWQEDFADDAKELLPASPTYSPPEIPANISANSKRPSRQSLVTTAFHDAFLDDMPHSPPDTHTRKRKREKTPLFMSSSLTDEDEDEADSPFSRPDTRRSTNHQVLYSLGPSPEMPPPNQDSSTNRMGCLSRTPSEAHLSHRAVSVESDEVLYNSRVAEDYHKERIIVLVSPDGSPQSQSKSKRSQHSSPRVKTYSKRRPHVYAPGFPHALNPAQRLPLTPEPGWWQANVRSKRRRSTSLWPEPELAYVREPLSQIEPEQDEWHEIARPRRSRNCPWPEECKEDVPGSFDVASPEDEAERRPRVGIRRLTEVCDVKRCPGIPAWAQGEDVRMLERRRKGKGRASPPDGANGTSRPPRLELNLTRAESCQQHIEEYVAAKDEGADALKLPQSDTTSQVRSEIQDKDHKATAQKENSARYRSHPGACPSTHPYHEI